MELQPGHNLVAVTDMLKPASSLSAPLIQRHDAALPNGRAYGYTEHVALFWLNYRYSDGPAGVVVLESGDLIHARLKVALAGLDHGLEFASGHTLDAESARQIPEAMIGRLLNDGDLRRLHRILITKKPPAPSVRRVREGNAAKR
jgi:hypothetical protein